MIDELRIIDCHQHFYDSRLLHYDVFAKPSAGLTALVGDYAALPRIYRPEDYARDIAGLTVAGTVWAEFISSNPLEEVRWAATLAREAGRPSSLIALVDFADPAVDRLLDAYQTTGPVRCVRQHVGWHPMQPALRFTSQPGLMADPAWRRGLASLRGRGLVCEIEVFGSQLREFSSLAAAYPDLQFVLSVMGWPIDLTEEGHALWKRDLATVGACPNVTLKIFGIECIFGVRWTMAQVRPWILDAIEIFSPDRCMFASHLPISKHAQLGNFTPPMARSSARLLRSRNVACSMTPPRPYTRFRSRKPVAAAASFVGDRCLVHSGETKVIQARQREA